MTTSQNLAYLTHTLSIRLTDDERAALEQRAARESRTLSNLVRKFLREHLLNEQ
jgi:hypothetical protein